jgi:WD40 repeat protein
MHQTPMNILFKKKKYKPKIKPVFTCFLLFTAIIITSCMTPPSLPSRLNFHKIAVLEGHNDQVLALDISPDGKMIASGSTDTTVRIWSIPEKRQLEVIKSHPDYVYSVAFSPDSKQIATGCQDTFVRIFSVKSGLLLHEMAGHAAEVYYVAYDPSGRYIASAGLDETVRLWSVQEGRLLRVMRRHSNKVNTVAFSPDGRYLISGSTDGTAKIWSVPEGRLLRTVKPSGFPIYAIAASPNGANLAIATMDEHDEPDIFYKKYYPIYIYEYKQGELTKWKKLPGHNKPVWSLAFTPDSSYLVSGGKDDTFKLWDITYTQDFLESIESKAGDIWQIDISPDGSLIALACSNNVIELYSNRE